MRTLATLFLLAQFVVAGPPQAQPPAAKPGTGLIVGRVIDGDSSQPIAGASVRIIAEGPPPATVAAFTSADGQFVVTSVSAGTTRLMVAKPGYVRNGANQHFDEGITLTITEGERRGDVVLRLWKLGAITGTVTDERGDPIVGLMMGAAPVTWVAGQRRVSSETISGQSDDRGVYRIPRLQPGEYVVYTMFRQSTVPACVIADKQVMEEAGLWTTPAGTRNGLRVDAFIVSGSESLPPQRRADGLYVYSPVFHPGAVQATAAKPIALRSGEEVSGVDFTLRPQLGLRVSGRAVGPDGPLAKFPLHLVPAGNAEFDVVLGGPVSSTVTDSAGRFTFLGVTPGSYSVRALKGPSGVYEASVIMIDAGADAGVVVAAERIEAPAPDKRSTEPTWHGSTAVSISDRPVDDTLIEIRRGVRLTGQFEFVGGKAPDTDSLKALALVIDQADGRVGPEQLELSGWTLPNGRFETAELPPGQYLIRAGNLAGWEFDVALIGGRNVTDVPFEVGDTPPAAVTLRFTNKKSQLTGSVRGLGEAPAVVAVFPADRSKWTRHGRSPRFLKSTTPDRNGAFSIDGLPAGDYFVSAFIEIPFSDWRSPVVLDAISQGAERVTIAAGGQKSVNLTVTTLPKIQRTP